MYNSDDEFSVLQNSKDLFITLKSDLKEDDNIIVKKLIGFEKLSELFEFQLVFTSKNNAIDLEKALSSKINIKIKSDKHERYIDGIITDFFQCATEQKDDIYLTEYRAVIRPQLWLLTLDNNHLIFQNKTTMDIIKAVLKDGNIKNIDDKTSSCGKTKREYCVQYGESSFNFISRLMEEDGIFYFFTHTSSKHTLVLADSANAYAPINGDKKIDFLKVSTQKIPLGKIFNTAIHTSVQTGAYSTIDYNYTTSQTKLFSKIDSKWKGEMFYEFPGRFTKAKEGDDYAKLRVQIFEFKHKLFKASSTVQSFVPAGVFNLEGHPSSAFNKEYALYAVEHKFDVASENYIYVNHFQAFEKSVIFRPERSTKKPRIHGSQTAIVTGKDSNEIFRDKYCCVKVHFHWDLKGKKENNTESSCWVRVAQVLAGSGWGGVFVPRIGQEVVVNYLEGDPDRPLIVGCVYNDNFLPAYSDKEAMKSSLKTVTFKDNKSKKGFNEFRFNDEKDKEEIYLHAQKDMYVDIIHSRKVEIEESDDLLDIFKGSRTIKLQAKGNSPGHLTTTLTKGDMITDLKKGDMKTTLTEGHMKTLLKKGDMFTDLKKGNYTLTIDGDLKIKVTGVINIEAGKDIKIKAGAELITKSSKATKMEAGMDLITKSGTATKMESGTDFAIKAGTNSKMEAGVNMEFKSGVNTKMKAGVNFDLEGGVGVKMKGGVTFEAKSGVSTKLMGTMVDIKGDAMCKVNAPMSMIGGGMVKLG